MFSHWISQLSHEIAIITLILQKKKLHIRKGNLLVQGLTVWKFKAGFVLRFHVLPLCLIASRDWTYISFWAPFGILFIGLFLLCFDCLFFCCYCFYFVGWLFSFALWNKAQISAVSLNFPSFSLKPNASSGWSLIKVWMFITELFGNTANCVHNDCRLEFKWTAQHWYGQMNLVALKEISLEGKILIPRWFLFPKTSWGLTSFMRLPSEPPENYYPQKMSLCNKSKQTVSFHLGSVQFSSVTQSCLTLCDPMNRSMPGLPVHHQFLEFTQTHVHRVIDAIQPSHPLSSPSTPAPNPSQHQSLFQWVNSSHEVAKILEFQL